MKKPAPTHEKDSENPSYIKIIGDTDIAKLGIESSFRWEVFSKNGENNTILFDGTGDTIGNDIISQLSPLPANETYYARLYETFVPYYGYNNCTGYIDVAFHIKKPTTIQAANSIDFGAHTIESTMTIPWQSIDGITPENAVNGIIPVAHISIGTDPVSKVTLSASPMTNAKENKVLDNVVKWGILDKNTNIINLQSLEDGGITILKSSENNLANVEKDIVCINNSEMITGFYFVTQSNHISDLTTGNYSATITWGVHYTP